MTKKGMMGAEIVEFALVVFVFFFILFSTIQFALYLENTNLMTAAARAGAGLLSTKRGYANPYTDTAPKMGAYDAVRKLLDDTMAPKATLDTALAITIEIRTPYLTSAACASACTCSGCVCSAAYTCVAPCSNNSSCQSALGTMDTQPAVGAEARVSLTYTFTPLFSTFGVANLSRINAEASAPVE